jgi:kumamolisin
MRYDAATLLMVVALNVALQVHSARGRSTVLEPADVAFYQGIWAAYGPPLSDDDVVQGTTHIYRSASWLARKGTPGMSDVAARDEVAEWLRPFGTACTDEGYAIHCRNVTVGAARRVFDLPTAAFRRYTARDPPPPMSRQTSSAFTLEPLKVPEVLQDVISHVTGLVPFNYRELRTTHMGRVLGTDGRVQPHDDTQGVDGRWYDFAVAPRPGNPRPLIVSVSSSTIYVALRCSDGNATILTVTGWCANASLSPTALTVSLLGSSSTSSNVPVATLDASFSDDCAAAEAFPALQQSPSSPSKGVVVCRIRNPIPAGAPVGRFDTYNVSATVAYANGVIATATPRNFFSTVVFERGAADVTDPTGLTTWTLDPPSPQVISPRLLTADDIAARHAIPLSDMQTTPGDSASSVAQGVVQFTHIDAPGTGFSVDDVQQYWVKVLNRPLNALGEIVTVGNCDIASRLETTLDLEMLTALTPGVPTYVFCADYGSPRATYASFADALAGFAANAFTRDFGFGVASVWSISYGGPEWVTTSVERFQAHYVDGLFQQLAAAGITVVASSGDTGSFEYWPVDGSTAAGSSSAAQQSTAYFHHGPCFPASSPNVLAAGGTALRRQTSVVAAATSELGLDEIACEASQDNIITSGGGYSKLFAGPPGQSAAFPSAATTRGVPDVAALAAWVSVIVNGTQHAVFGTSVSAPILAAAVSRLNWERISQQENAPMVVGERHLRFVTQMVYSDITSASFTDITGGSSCSGAVPPRGLPTNYPSYPPATCAQAVVGWDAVTGMGSLNFTLLRQLATGWQPPSADVLPFPAPPSPSSGPLSSAAPRSPPSGADKYVMAMVYISAIVATFALLLGCCFICRVPGMLQRAERRRSERSTESAEVPLREQRQHQRPQPAPRQSENVAPGGDSDVPMRERARFAPAFSPVAFADYGTAAR